MPHATTQLVPVPSPSIVPAGMILKLHGDIDADVPRRENHTCTRTELDPVSRRFLTHEHITVTRKEWAESVYAGDAEWRTRIVGNLIVADKYTFFG